MPWTPLNRAKIKTLLIHTTPLTLPYWNLSSLFYWLRTEQSSMRHWIISRMMAVIQTLASRTHWGRTQVAKATLGMTIRLQCRSWGWVRVVMKVPHLHRKLIQTLSWNRRKSRHPRKSHRWSILTNFIGGSAKNSLKTAKWLCRFLQQPLYRKVSEEVVFSRHRRSDCWTSSSGIVAIRHR